MSVIVTGACGGIGRAIADAFMASGSRVIGQDLMPPADPAKFAGWISGDILSEATQRALAEASAETRLDVLVLAHGIAGSGAISTIESKTVRRIMEIDFESCVATTDVLASALRVENGSLVVVSSQAGLVGEANNSIYCAAKFALIGWLRSTHWDGIRPRALCPGVTDTPLLQRALQGMSDAEGVPYEAVVQRRRDRTTVGRLGHPSDMAAAALWLAGLATPGLVVAPVTGGEVVY